MTNQDNQKEIERLVQEAEEKKKAKEEAEEQDGMNYDRYVESEEL